MRNPHMVNLSRSEALTDLHLHFGSFVRHAQRKDIGWGILRSHDVHSFLEDVDKRASYLFRVVNDPALDRIEDPVSYVETQISLGTDVQAEDVPRGYASLLPSAGHLFEPRPSWLFSLDDPMNPTEDRFYGDIISEIFTALDSFRNEITTQMYPSFRTRTAFRDPSVLSNWVDFAGQLRRSIQALRVSITRNFGPPPPSLRRRKSWSTVLTRAAERRNATRMSPMASGPSSGPSFSSCISPGERS